MKRIQSAIWLTFLSLSCGAAHAANIAVGATGIIGVNTAIDSGLGTPYERGDQGPGTSRLNDGVYGTDGVNTTVMDTWNGAPAASGTFAYVGMTDLNVPAGEQVTNVVMNVATFFDGGWFGPNAAGPGNGGVLGAVDHLSVPTVQVTSDGGTTWTSIASDSNDYVAQLEGHAIGDTAANNPTFATVTFPLNDPQVGINGIRLIGSEGGGPAGDDLGGFIGAAEFEVNTSAIPEPSSALLIFLSGLGLFAWRRR